MPHPKLDLEYEVQMDMGWDLQYSKTAVSEYMRYLQIRAKEKDFKDCKLPPSRVVGVVWSIHRQWSLDYQHACSKLGGFIHHFPPAMRLSVSREQAYSNTFHAYKTHFKEEPPVNFWANPIYRPNPAFLASHIPDDTDEVQHNTTDLPNGRANGNDAENGLYKNQLQNRNYPNHQTSNDKSYQYLETSTIPDNTSRRSQLATNSPDYNPSDNVQTARIEGTTNYNEIFQEEFSMDPSRNDPYAHERQRYVLRPLRPGEKRRRGRPSFSEYVTFEEYVNIRGELDREEMTRNMTLPDSQPAHPNETLLDKPTRPRKYGLPKASALPGSNNDTNPRAVKTVPYERSFKRYRSPDDRGADTNTPINLDSEEESNESNENHDIRV